MLTILQVMLIVWAGLIGWGIGYSISTAIENYRMYKRARILILQEIQRQQEDLEKILENIRKETK